MTSHEFTLTDDDGCLVLSTEIGMKYWASHSFEYDFPSELLEHMKEKRIVAWEAGEEGEHKVKVIIDSDIPEDAIGPFRLLVHDDDQIIAMPYSQFSYVADGDDGEVEDIEGLSYRFAASPGEYDVFLKRINEFLIYITPAGHRQLMTFTNELPEP